MRRFTLPGLSMVEICIIVLLLCVVALILFPVLARDRSYPQRQTGCVNNQKQIAQAMLMYAQEHQGEIPTANRVWHDLVTEPKVLFCKIAGGKPRNTYGINATVAGKSQQDPFLPEATNAVLTAEVKDGRDNIFWTYGDLDFRHEGKMLVSLLDGHVELRTYMPNFTYLSQKEVASGVATITELTQGFDFQKNQVYRKTASSAKALPSGWVTDRELPGHPLCGVFTRKMEFAPSLCFLWARDGNIGKGYQEDLGREGLQVAFTNIPAITPVDTRAWIISMRLSTVAWGYWSPEKQSATSIRTQDATPCIAIYDDSGTDIHHPGRLLGLLEFRVTNKNDPSAIEVKEKLCTSQLLFNGNALVAPRLGWSSTTSTTVSRWCSQGNAGNPDKVNIAPFPEFNHFDLDQATDGYTDTVADITFIGLPNEEKIICLLTAGGGGLEGSIMLPYHDTSASGIPKMLLFRTGNADGGGACMYQLYRKPDGSVISFSTLRR